jgi:hypothetical protein
VLARLALAGLMERTGPAAQDLAREARAHGKAQGQAPGSAGAGAQDGGEAEEAAAAQPAEGAAAAADAAAKPQDESAADAARRQAGREGRFGEAVALALRHLEQSQADPAWVRSAPARDRASRRVRCRALARPLCAEEAGRARGAQAACERRAPGDAAGADRRPDGHACRGRRARASIVDAPAVLRRGARAGVSALSRRRRGRV